MLFNSIDFLLVFLPITLLGYYGLGALGGIWSRLWLCVASMVFYAWMTPALIFILLASIVFNFAVSVLIAKTETNKPLQQLVFFGGIIGDLTALFYYKYAVWVLSLFSGLGLPVGYGQEIVLPLGISFFTFTQIGYLIDCKDGVAKERGFINYLLFVTFFPHLIAGPILHHKEVMPQFAEKTIDRFDLSNITVGLTVFLAGLFKKTVIADSFAPMVDIGFSHTANIGVGAAWITSLAYLIQLYFDFSGYSDMAVGLARMFNVRFPLNFNSPYKARNVTDYWQRWHMTLTRYLNAYLFNPIAIGNTRKLLTNPPPGVRNPLDTQKGFFLTITLPTLFTMTLAGIWHGAGAQYLVFGVLHGSFIVAYRAWQPHGKKLNKAVKSPWLRVAGGALATFITLFFINIAEVFFRAPSVSSALGILQGMVGLHSAANPYAGTGAYSSVWIEAAAILIAFAFVWISPNIYQILGPYSPALTKVKPNPVPWLSWQPNALWASAVGAMGAAAVIAIGMTSAFLYFQF